MEMRLRAWDSMEEFEEYKSLLGDRKSLDIGKAYVKKET